MIKINNVYDFKTSDKTIITDVDEYIKTVAVDINCDDINGGSDNINAISIILGEDKELFKKKTQK